MKTMCHLNKIKAATPLSKSPTHSVRFSKAVAGSTSVLFLLRLLRRLQLGETVVTLLNLSQALLRQVATTLSLNSTALSLKRAARSLSLSKHCISREHIKLLFQRLLLNNQATVSFHLFISRHLRCSQVLTVSSLNLLLCRRMFTRHRFNKADMILQLNCKVMRLQLNLLLFVFSSNRATRQPTSPSSQPTALISTVGIRSLSRQHTPLQLKAMLLLPLLQLGTYPPLAPSSQHPQLPSPLCKAAMLHRPSHRRLSRLILNLTNYLKARLNMG